MRGPRAFGGPVQDCCVLMRRSDGRLSVLLGACEILVETWERIPRA